MRAIHLRFIVDFPRPNAETISPTLLKGKSSTRFVATRQLSGKFGRSIHSFRRGFPRLSTSRPIGRTFSAPSNHRCLKQNIKFSAFGGFHEFIQLFPLLWNAFG